MAIVALGLITAGCGRYFAPDRNLRERLEESDVVGTWRLTAESLRLLERDGFKRDPSHRYTLTLKPDHTCEFAAVFDDLKTLKYVVAPCTWRLEHDTRGDSNVWKANALSLDLNLGGGTSREYWNFAREGGQLRLWDDHGDPDNWEFIEFSRVDVGGG